MRREGNMDPRETTLYRYLSRLLDTVSMCTRLSRGGFTVSICLGMLLAVHLGRAESGNETQAREAASARELTIEDAYHLAFANEEQIKIAGLELAKAQLLPWRAIAQLTPRADVFGTYIRN